MKTLSVRCCSIFILSFFFIFPDAAFANSRVEQQQFIFPPVFDFRSDSSVDYTSLNIGGPVFKYERKGSEYERALRPLFHYSTDQQRDASQLDILFPLFTYRDDKDVISSRFLFLLHFYSHQANNFSQRDFSLFPLIFYKKKLNQPTQYALFPVVGNYFNKFNRDELSYFLFPLYVHSKRKGTYVDNYLWPFFARISGDAPDESGFKIWPLYGHSKKPGVYRKSMFAWPFWISQDLRLDTSDPLTTRYSFPFYLYSEAPSKSLRNIIWPFFSYVDDRKNNYTEWNFPWPLFSFTKGKQRHGYKALPLISDMTTGSKRTRNYLWPLYRIEEKQFSTLSQTRSRVLFFLFTNLVEREKESERLELHRTLFWPLFGYRHEEGVSHFYTLALLEPIFQYSDGITRNWSPLWRIYQQKWDDQGNSVSSALWNIFWHERSQKGLAWELFPFLSYRHEPAVLREWSILKGLIRVHNEGEKKRLHLFYLPWGIPMGRSEL
jgi:hypothetical protein